MLETVRKPNTFYAIDDAVINQIGLTKDVYNYYCTSYSRGTDGLHMSNNPNFNNEYLNGYSQQRSKSIFDPCPYGFRVPTNGTYNYYSSVLLWMQGSYVAGVKFKYTWFSALGYRWSISGVLKNIGERVLLYTATIYSENCVYSLWHYYKTQPYLNNGWSHSEGLSVRCIEDELKTNKYLLYLQNNIVK